MGSHWAKPDLFQFQLLSDIHLEFRCDRLQNRNGFRVPHRHAPYLALLGDIGAGFDNGYENLERFVRSCCDKFETVFFVLGNHECYGSSLVEGIAFLEGLEGLLGRNRFAFLNCSHFDVPRSNVRVLGCTLWTYLPEATRDRAVATLNDFRHISDMTPELYVAEHLRQVAWLHEALAVAHDEGKLVVVMTHHAPTIVDAAPAWNKDAYRIEVELGIGCTALIAGCEPDVPQPTFNRTRYPHLVVWAFGHTHWNCDSVQHGVRVVSNQVGYPKDRYYHIPHFIPHHANKVVRVDFYGQSEPEPRDLIEQRAGTINTHDDLFL